jgi:histone-lysine N-methyltransferase SETD1
LEQTTKDAGGQKVRRILAKDVDGSRDKNAAGQRGAAEEQPELEREENRRELEMNRLRYQALSSAYLLDPFARLEVRRSHIHNWGLFCKSSFEKDAMIVEYIGQKIRQAVADRREIKYEEEGVGSCYLFRLDGQDIVDATRTGGMARFINHCCEPNAYAKIVLSDEDGRRKHIVIMAARHIQVCLSLLSLFLALALALALSWLLCARTNPNPPCPCPCPPEHQAGEEITYDYKFPIEDVKLRCFCGASRCKGSMN